jgi:hypothetical protein
LWPTRQRQLRQLTRLRDRVSREIDKLGERWEIVSSVPKRNLRPPVALLPNRANLAVVMQGPIVTEDDLTSETLRLYATTFPHVKLVLSTWAEESRDVLRQMERLGVTVIKSQLPACPGPANLNCQILSTRAGISAARDLGAEYILKTRTDTRLCATGVGDYLVGLLDAFGPARHSPQRRRIALLDLATRLYIPQHASDVLMFGHVEDLHRYWDTPLVQPTVRFSETKVFGEFLRDPIPEVLLCESYLARVEYPVRKSIDSWWQALADLFLVVDRTSLRFFWPKHNYSRDHTMSDDDEARNLALCSFREWVNIALFDKHPTVDIDSLATGRLNGYVAA